MSLILFVLVFSTSLYIARGQGSLSNLQSEQLTEAARLFSGLEEVKNYFRNSSNYLAKNILDTFENECFYMEDPDLPTEKSRKPFIVLEGNHKNSRDVVGVRLASMLGGRYLVHPAPCLIKYLDSIPKGTLLRRAFYVLSLYASSFNAKVHLSLGRSVVLNGYWLDQLSFSLIQSVPDGMDLPPPEDDIYNKPLGLLQPDLIFYLNLPDNLFRRQITTRSPDNWKSRALTLYRGLSQRLPVVIQNLKGVFRVTTDEVYERIVEELMSKRDIVMRRPQTNFDYTDN